MDPLPREHQRRFEEKKEGRSPLRTAEEEPLTWGTPGGEKQEESAGDHVSPCVLVPKRVRSRRRRLHTSSLLPALRPRGARGPQPSSPPQGPLAEEGGGQGTEPEAVVSELSWEGASPACFRQRNRKGRAQTWEEEHGQSVTRELGLERYEGEEGQGLVGHSGDTEFKCSEKLQGRVTRSGSVDCRHPSPFPHVAQRSCKWFPTAFWIQSKLLGVVVKALPPYTSHQPPAPPPSPEAGFHPQVLSWN